MADACCACGRPVPPPGPELSGTANNPVSWTKHIKWVCPGCNYWTKRRATGAAPKNNPNPQETKRER